MFDFRSGVLQANGIAPRPTSINATAGHENSSTERDVGTPDDHISEDIKPAELNDRIRSLEVSALLPFHLYISLIFFHNRMN